MSNKSTTKYIDYLTEDPVIPRQRFCLMSFLSPEGVKNCTLRGLKIRGIYETREEADEEAKKLQAIDGNFHVFVGDVGKWLPWDPDPNQCQSQEYKEKQLNDIMKEYLNNQEKAKQHNEERKENMIRNAAINEQDRSKQAKKKLQAKLEQRRTEKNTAQVVTSQVEEKVTVQEQQSVTPVQLEKKQTESTSEDKMAKIKELYNKSRN